MKFAAHLQCKMPSDEKKEDEPAAQGADMLSQLRAVADAVVTSSVREVDVKQLSIEMASVMLGGMLLGRIAEGSSGRPAMAGVKWGFFYFLFQGVAHVTSVARERDDMYNEAWGGAVAGGVFTLRGACDLPVFAER